jgi:hypothetical protein
MGIGLLQTHIYPTARKILRAQRGLGVWGLAPIKCNRKASFHTPFSITAPSTVFVTIRNVVGQIA